MKKIGKVFWILLFVCIIFRIALVAWVLPLPFASNGDLTRYEEWARVAHIYSLSDTYSGKHTKIVVNNEPPGTLYILSATYESYIIAGKIIAKITHTAPGSILWVNTFFLHLWMRIPSILAEIFLGIIGYFLVAQKKDDKNAMLTACLIWFNPALWYNSTLWGQMDSINNVFFALSLLLAFQKKYFFSLISYALSIYIKLSLLPLLPFYLVFLFFVSKKNIKLLTVSLVTTVLMWIVLTIPISSNPIIWLLNNIPNLAQGELQNITNAAFNFWWAISCGPTCNYPPVDTQLFLFISLATWGFGLFFATTLPILYLQVKRQKIFVSKKIVLLFFTLITLSIFLFLPKMHDRYLYPVFPLFAIAIGLFEKKKLFIVLYILLSLFHLVNLMYSWIPNYFPYFVMYQIIYSRLFDWIISMGIIITSAVLYIFSYKFLFSTKK